jgi:hypothetical protein
MEINSGANLCAAPELGRDKYSQANTSHLDDNAVRFPFNNLTFNG